MKKKVLYFGNETVPGDRAAVDTVNRIHDELAGIDFIHCSSPDDILRYDGEEAFILDVAKGIEKMVFLDDFGMLKKKEITSLHDFDLSFFLKLLEKLGRKTTFRIIAIPEDKSCDAELLDFLKSYEI